MSDDKKDVKLQKDYINLKVMGLDNAIVQFKIMKRTPLSKLINSYCSRKGLDARAIRFLFDGDRINDNHTPISLKMEEGDTIDVFQEQISGS